MKPIPVMAAPQASSFIAPFDGRSPSTWKASTPIATKEVMMETQKSATALKRNAVSSGCFTNFSARAKTNRIDPELKVVRCLKNSNNVLNVSDNFLLEMLFMQVLG